MRAVRIHRFGGPDEVRLEDVELPRAPPGRALVRVRAAAVNPLDWKIRERLIALPGADRVPLTLGRDYAGVVERIAPGTETPFRPGDEVLGQAWGSFAEYALVPVEDLVRKPDSLDFVVAAALPTPAVTAWQAIVEVAQARAGMRFLVHGAGGGVGSLAAQLARWKGAEVAATASGPALELLRRAGVEPVVDWRRERFEDRVRDVDVVLDPVGGEVQARSWAVLKKAGLLVGLVGVDRAAAAQAGVHAADLVADFDPDALRDVAALVERGLVRPHIARVLPLERAREALDLSQTGRSHGRIVLEVR